MKRTETVKRDNLVVEFLIDNKGRENALSKYIIADYLTENGYPQRADTVHGIIERLIRERHLPICSINGKGIIGRKQKRIFWQALTSCNHALRLCKTTLNT